MQNEKRNLKILIYADFYGDKVYQGIDYMRMFEPYGKVHLLTSSDCDDEVLLQDYDMLVLPGGADVDPSRYGEKPHPMCGRVNAQYEYMDTHFLPKWLETGKPIVGICRGMQTLNVALGGSLYQHIVGHTGGEDRTDDVHKMYTNIYPESADVRFIDAPEDFRKYGVNSYHHQNVKRLAEGFEVLGHTPIFRKCESLLPFNRKDLYLGYRWSTDKKSLNKPFQTEGMWFEEGYPSFIEIIKHKTKPYIAFQYHPENTCCPLAHYLIDLTLTENGY